MTAIRKMLLNSPDNTAVNGCYPWDAEYGYLEYKLIYV